VATIAKINRPAGPVHKARIRQRLRCGACDKARSSMERWLPAEQSATLSIRPPL
jgi:hypothetical protein